MRLLDRALQVAERTRRAMTRIAIRCAPAEISLHLQYRRKVGRFGSFRKATRFTEHIQRRKLFDSDPRFSQLTDKIEAKAFVRKALGEDWIIPTLWFGDELPEHPPAWRRPYVLKATHGTGWNIFVLDEKDEDWPAIRRKTGKWLSCTYGKIKKERHYAFIKPRLLVEPFVGLNGRTPTDYKAYVFGGRVELIEGHVDRFTDHGIAMFQPDWTPIKCTWGTQHVDHDAVPCPKRLPAIIQAAERLAAGFDFVRVDFYEIDGQPKFGEMTFAPASGFGRFLPDRYDLELGALWTKARQTAAA